MFIPGPPLTPLAVFQDIDIFLSELDGIESISGGIGVYGPAAAYALVWELGSLRLKKPGPRTVWGTNRDNQKRIMSSQAPGGYVGIISEEFWPIIQAEIDKVDFSSSNINLKLEVAVDNASQKIAELVRSWAPEDTGELRSDILGVDSDEVSFLQQNSDLESFSTLIL